MANFFQITPVMHVQDVEDAVRFFVDILGFTIQHQSPLYAYVDREVVGMRIMKASDEPEEIPGPGTRAFRYYIDVRDVETVIAEVKPRCDSAGIGVYGPVDQRYGQREFMVMAPDGDMLVFGQDISSTLSGG